MLPIVAMKSVWPSASARAAASVPIVPLAPARFSTTTACPQISPRRGAMRRATMSVPPPGGKATMTRTGLVGNAWAEPTSKARSRMAIFMRGRRRSFDFDARFAHELRKALGFRLHVGAELLRRAARDHLDAALEVLATELLALHHAIHLAVQAAEDLGRCPLR